MPLAQNFTSIQNNAGLPAWNVLITPGGLISKTLPYIFGGAAMALLVYLIMGGFQMMTSQGDPKALQGAQGKISSALTGFVIVIITYALVSLLGSVLNIEAFSNIFGSASSGPGR